MGRKIRKAAVRLLGAALLVCSIFAGGMQDEAAAAAVQAEEETTADAALSAADLIDLSELTGFAAVAGEGLDTTTGGGSASLIIIDGSDPDAQYTLMDALTGSRPAVVAIRGTVALSSTGTIKLGSNKTIVGLDQDAAIAGSLYTYEAQNIIISNLQFIGNRNSYGGDDCLCIEKTHHVWLDHVSFRDSTDETLDIKAGSDYITVSWCTFSYSEAKGDHRFSCLVSSGTGNDATDEGKFHVTFHHNWFGDNILERMPRVLYGQAHIYNNYYSAKDNTYCIGIASKAAALIENNYFKDVNNPIVFMYSTSPGYITQRNNIFDNTDGWIDEGYGGGWTPYVEPFDNPPYDYTIDPAEDVPSLVQTYAGPQDFLDGVKAPQENAYLVTPAPAKEPETHTPAPAPTPYPYAADNPVTYDEATDTYTFHGMNDDWSNGQLEIENPFAENGNNSWYSEYSLAFWVYLPEGSGDAPVLTFNLENDRQVSCFDAYKYDLCRVYDEYLSLASDEDAGFTMQDTMFGMGSSDPQICLDENGKEYTVLTEPGDYVVYNAEYPTEGYYRKDAKGAIFVYPQGSDPADEENWFAVSYIGEGYYEHYSRLYDEEGGENSRVSEGYVSGSFCIYASGSVGFMQDIGTATEINPNLPAFGKRVQIQPFNSYYYWGNGCPTDDYQYGSYTPTMEKFDEWHFVVAAIDPIEVKLYIDGEEMDIDYLHVGYKKLTEQNYYAEMSGIGFGYYQWRERLYQSAMSIPQMLSDPDTRVFVGGNPIAAWRLGQEIIGTEEGVMVKNIAWYDRYLYPDEIAWDGVSEDVTPIAGTASVPSGNAKPTPQPTATPTPTSTPTPEPVYSVGDADKDGAITAADALKVLRIVVKLDMVTSNKDFVLADADADKKITAEDALLILKYVVRLIDRFA